MIDGVEVEMSSGNVFADVGLPDADRRTLRLARWFRLAA